MRIASVILIVLFSVEVVMSGPIKTQVTTNPESVATLIQSGNYQNILTFVRAAYAESKAEGDDEITQYAYLMVLSQVPAAMRIPLAVDFAMDESDPELNAQGARAVRLALLDGASLTAPEKQALVTKLKSKLSALSGSSMPKFDFARFAADALMLLGDDAGLDVFLTGSEFVGNLKSSDGWTPTSNASVFAQLKASYEAKAADPSNENRGSDTVTAAMYELCRVRRTEDKEVKPLQPLANLDQLLPK